MDSNMRCFFVVVAIFAIYIFWMNRFRLENFTVVDMRPGAPASIQSSPEIASAHAIEPVAVNSPIDPMIATSVSVSPISEISVSGYSDDYDPMASISEPEQNEGEGDEDNGEDNEGSGDYPDSLSPPSDEGIESSLREQLDQCRIDLDRITNDFDICETRRRRNEGLETSLSGHVVEDNQPEPTSYEYEGAGWL